MTEPRNRVTLLYVLVLTLTAWNGLRLGTAFAWNQILTKYSFSMPPFFTALSGATWMLLGLFLIWSMWQKKAWTGSLLIGSAAGYSTFYWAERVLWQLPHPNWIFAITVNLAGFIIILSNVRTLMREAHERENENSKIN
jgi:hypothetical protein